MSAKMVTKFISKQDKETITRLNLSQEITELEFKQKTNLVTESLLKAKCLYVMSVMFAIDLPQRGAEDVIRTSPELNLFLQLLHKNNMSSMCIFIPFRSLNEYLQKFPLTVFLFAKNNMEDCIDPDDTPLVQRTLISETESKGRGKPVCYHVVYRSNASSKVDTFKTIGEAYARMNQLSKHPIQQFICQFDYTDEKEYYISVRQISK
jgi:hypothetical protein